MSVALMSQLVKELNTYRDAYYNLSQPTVSDSVYDAKYDELVQLEKRTGIILSTSPTQTIGYVTLDKLEKVTHDTPLLSLDKTKSVEDLSIFINNEEYILMTKNDGLTVELLYEDGKLQQGSTRGDGYVGSDITHCCKTFKNIPLTIPFDGTLRISGEAVIHLDDFININDSLTEGVKKYKHPRNLCSGSVNQLNSEECSKRFIKFYAFNIIECDADLSDSKTERFKWLTSLGFTTVYFTKSNYSDVATLECYINTLQQFAKTNFLPIDGMVISFDSVKYSQSLGLTSHHPLHSKAFKFEDDVAVTTLLDVEWSMGKTSITPVAIFEEVDIDGSNVSRASLHNVSIMETLQLGVGDDIGVIKANMIIPQVITNLTRSNNIVIPTECPCCKAPTQIKQDNESKVLICTNNNCSAKMLKKLSHFVSRDAMNIDGLSEATLEKFVQSGFIKEFSDIYEIARYKDVIVKMDGFGKKSYDKLISAIDKSRITDMYRIIYSLSIPNIGKTASKTISTHFNQDMDKFLDALCMSFDFSILKDFGVTTNESIQTWCDELINLTQLGKLLEYVAILQPKPKVEIEGESKVKDLTGLTFCCTGEFSTKKVRASFEETINARGGKVSGTVSKKTAVLITNDKTSGSKKNKDADTHSVPIMNEEEFNIYLTTP